MDAEKKKPILLGIVVVCLVLAGGITYFKTAKGPDGCRLDKKRRR